MNPSNANTPSGRLQNEALPTHNQLQSQVPIIGGLSVGAKQTSQAGKEYPVSLDYFRASGKYAQFFHDIYGERPNAVHIIFPTNDPRECCNCSITYRDKGGRLLAEGDGVNWRIWSFKRQEHVFGKCSIEEVSALFHDAKQSTELRLRFILPRVNSVFGLWKFSTRAHRSTIPLITGVFDTVLAEVGYVQNIPFELSVQKVQSNKPGIANVYPVVQMVPVLSPDNLQMLAEFHASGQNIRGMITEEKIEQLRSDAPRLTTGQKMLQDGNG